MKAQDLKNSILQLAIQGKLVEQREEEGTAKELIEQIGAEKEKLIKEGKIPKEKKLPIITEEEKAFDLPLNWQYTRVQDIASYITDYVANGSFASLKKNTKTFKTKNYAIFVRTMDLTSNFKGECSYIDKSSYDFLDKSKLHGGELILPNIGGSIGKAFLMPNLNMPMSLAPNSIMIKFLHPIMNKFFSYIIQSPYGSEFLRETKGGTATPKFSKTELRNMVILLPPLREIVRIVEKIEKLLPYLDQYDKAYTEVEELNKKFPEDMQKSILQYAIQGKLVEQREEDGTAEELYQKIQAEKEKLIKEGKIKKEKALPEITEDEIPFDIPASWKWVRLGELCNYGKCNSIPITKIPNDAWILDLEDIEKDSGRVLNKKRMKDIKSSSSKHIFKEGNILYSKLRPYLNKVVIADEDGYSTSEILPLDFGMNIYNRYAQIVLMNPYFINYTVKCSYGVKMPRLGTTDGQMAVFPLPPLDEQKRIVEKIEEILPYTKQLIKKINM